MKRFLEAVSLTVALLIASAANCQSNLDKPISTKPTVRSEIARGHDAAFECNGVGKIGRFRLIEACVSKVVQDNVQQEKASTTFKLGIYLVASRGHEMRSHGADRRPIADGIASSRHVDRASITARAGQRRARHRRPRFRKVATSPPKRPPGSCRNTITTGH